MSTMRIASGMLDLRYDTCPITWVKTRIELERIGEGELLVLLLREGEPLRNVPATAIEEGHLVVSKQPLQDEGPGTWEVVLEKGAPKPALDLP
jgi:tRNA 2-thiouridine synthesizing protein A